MTFLVDTNVLSELARPRPEPSVLDWAARVTGAAFSVITLDEIHYGLAAKPNARAQAWFESFLDRWATVLPVTSDVARIAGQMRGRLAARGRPRTQADMLIAATAHVHQLTVVTRNVRDFEDCGIGITDPFARGRRP